jgi:hypothetical protein
MSIELCIGSLCHCEHSEAMTDDSKPIEQAENRPKEMSYEFQAMARNS